MAFTTEAKIEPDCARVERERRIKDETTMEVAYYNASLDRARADAARLCELIRSHWEIENRIQGSVQG